jgi:rod shape determining protein RodA
MRLLTQIFSGIDWMIAVPVIILVLISLSTLFSIDPIYFRSQFFFLIISILAFIFFSQVNPNILKHYTIPIYIASIIMLGIILLVGIESRGSVRWLDILGVRFQFSEILKPFLAISLASFLSERKNYSFQKFIMIFAFLFPIALLIFLQPDLGNTLIYVGVVVLTLVVFGFPWKYFLTGLVISIMSFPLFWLTLHDYQRQRILVFLNPSHDPLGKSYNAIQAVIAVGSGMLVGKGLGQGTQSVLKFLPEHHTDFIFATISEEFGFIGSMIVLAAFVFLLYRIYLIYQNEEDSFSKIFTAIVFFTIFVHFFINVGMNIGLVPVVGVTLPFVSYGGSSMISNFILLGLLLAVRRSSTRREALEIR